MSTLYDALINLSPAHDQEMRDGYERYVVLLETLASAEQLDAYAAYIQEADEIRIFEEMTPGEIDSLPPAVQAVARVVMADINASMENRRVVALLNQRGQHAVAPDLGTTQETRERVYAP